MGETRENRRKPQETISDHIGQPPEREVATLSAQPSDFLTQNGNCHVDGTNVENLEQGGKPEKTTSEHAGQPPAWEIEAPSAQPFDVPA